MLVNSDKLAYQSERSSFLQVLHKLTKDSQRLETQLDAILILKLKDLEKLESVLDYQKIELLLDNINQDVKRVIRNTDYVFWLGDYKFGFILQSLLDKEILYLAANKILSILENPYTVGGHEIRVRGHIGATTLPPYKVNVENLLTCANSALHESIDSNTPFSIYKKTNGSTSEYDLSLESELHKAVTNHELSMYFQPQLDLSSNRISGAEALIRWHSKKHGKVPTDLFIAIAEKTGLISLITEWVLENVARYQSFLARQGIDINISINLSTYDLCDRDFPTYLKQILDTWTIPADKVTLEITEGAMMENPKLALKTMFLCKDLGVHLSIDDFGTGYSSLEYLKDLPVDELKIDQSFVKGIRSIQSNEQIVRSVLDLAHHFKLKVVAEGVEDEQTCQILAKLGCDVAQGYYITPPLSENEFVKWIKHEPFQSN